MLAFLINFGRAFPFFCVTDIKDNEFCQKVEIYELGKARVGLQAEGGNSVANYRAA